MLTVPKKYADRRNAWIRRDHAEIIERNKPVAGLSFQAALDNLIESALRQRRWIGSEKTE